MANKATDTCSPDEINASYSLGSGISCTPLAKSISLCVSPAIAETTATTFLPVSEVSLIILATALNLFVSASDVPPNFWITILDIEFLDFIKDFLSSN